MHAFGVGTARSMESVITGIFLKVLHISRHVVGIISINCILRYLFFENNSYTFTYAKMMQEMSNNVHFGVIGDGEQYVEQHVNQTMVCAVFIKGH